LSIQASAKYAIIREMTLRDNNRLNISWLCETACVSRSGYYSYIENEAKRQEREEADRKDFLLIVEAYKFRGYDKGARGIKMRLLHLDPPVNMNLKKIRRLMKKYRLLCPIRKANPYRRMAKALKTSHVSPNLVARQFEAHGPRKVLLTDITYILYKDSGKCYLSTIIDAFTKQLLAWVLSKSLEVDFVLETVELLVKNHGDELSPDTLLHSDQGVHYTSVKYVELLKNKELRQSMSRRANCWDNAPQESFFGHMKDEIGDRIKKATSFSQIRKVITDWTDYYNKDRYVWELARLSPDEYYKYYMTGIYPIPGITPPKKMETTES
jgi:transposase InsO family protein